MNNFFLKRRTSTALKRSTCFKIAIFFLLYLVLPTNTKAQNYIAYQKEITKAERQILDSNYVDAMNIYYNLFQDYDFVYAKNCYTALQLAVKNKDKDKSYYFLTRAVKQGIHLRTIEAAPIMKDIIKFDFWKDFEENTYDSLRTIYLTNINTELREEILEIFAVDQFLTIEMNESKFINYEIKSIKWTKIIDDHLENKLIPIIKKYGFPGEKIIGITNDWVINYKEKDKMFTTTKQLETEGISGVNQDAVLFMFIHYYSNARVSYDSLLYQELLKGNIEAASFASIVDFESKYGKKYHAETYYNQWHRTGDAEKREAINKRRLSIGLDTYEILKKKERRNYRIRKEIKKGNYNHIKIWTGWGIY